MVPFQASDAQSIETCQYVRSLSNGEFPALQGQWQRALHFFYRANMAASIGCDVISYSALISACEKGSQWPLALDLFHSMRFAVVDPNNYSFSAAIISCQKGLVECRIGMRNLLFCFFTQEFCDKVKGVPQSYNIIPEVSNGNMPCTCSASCPPMS